ncbi:cell division protein FtsL [Xylocopilactobacillus apicola]|uniref:Cell division protein FtsL n=1 Tax=Xylocopilactobacillus apicola TaxID=2932184 RepID=A0AAU9D7E0_9LACO|nr:cell division protein FtsL [Xylocopilactobacillus apicola]BDR58301.1 hypothetical protein XA3_07420 [Xylocopilactobacillus apicola]
MRQNSIDSDIIYRGANGANGNSIPVNALPDHSIGTKTAEAKRSAAKDVSVGSVKVSFFERFLIFLCCGSVIVGLFIICLGRNKTSAISYQIDNVNNQIQTVKQENQDLNSEVQVLTNSSRLEKLAQEYGFQLDENRVQNVMK